MIGFLFKYGAVFFIVNTILLSIGVTMELGKALFLVLMGVFSIVLLIIE